MKSPPAILIALVSLTVGGCLLRAGEETRGVAAIEIESPAEGSISLRGPAGFRLLAGRRLLASAIVLRTVGQVSKRGELNLRIDLGRTVAEAGFNGAPPAFSAAFVDRGSDGVIDRYQGTGSLKVEIGPDHQRTLVALELEFRKTAETIAGPGLKIRGMLVSHARRVSLGSVDFGFWPGLYDPLSALDQPTYDYDPALDPFHPGGYANDESGYYDDFSDYYDYDFFWGADEWGGDDWGSDDWGSDDWGSDDFIDDFY